VLYVKKIVRRQCRRSWGAASLNKEVVGQNLLKCQFSYRQQSLYSQQAKDTLFRNRLQCLLFLVSIAGTTGSIAGTTGMNTTIENSYISFAKQKGANPCFLELFSPNICKTAYKICNPVFEIINHSRNLRELFRIMSMLIS